MGPTRMSEFTRFPLRLQSAYAPRKPPDVTPSQIAAVLGRLPSGLLILTARNGSSETGMLVSWVQQAGFEPPMLTVALQKNHLLTQWLAAGTPFALNLLADTQKRLVSHFGRPIDDDKTAFAGLDVARTSSGLPILNGTIGYLECEPAGGIDSGDHRVFLARIVGGHLDDGQHPLVHIRKNGLRY